jgi:hypothetical protein
MTTKPKTRKATPIMNVETLELAPRSDALLVDGQLVELAPGEALSMIHGTGVNPKLIALAAKIDKANALAEKRGTRAAVFKLEDSLAAIACTNLEEMKLKVRYVDADCIMDWSEQIGKLPASIIRDLLALNRKQKASA